MKTVNAARVADSGSATHGAAKASGTRKPPTAPTAPITPSAEDDWRVAVVSAAARSGVPGVVSRSAATFHSAGIIL